MSSLEPINIRVWNNEFEKDIKKYGMDGEAIPHSIFMHAEDKGDGKGEASVSYTLPMKSLAFQASVGIPEYEDPQQDPASPVTFEVLGDDKSLWKSEPITKLATFQKCTVNLDKVKTLTLRVRCQDYHWVQAVWFGPISIE